MRAKKYTAEGSKDREGEWEYTTVVESSNLIVFFTTFCQYIKIKKHKKFKKIAGAGFEPASSGL